MRQKLFRLIADLRFSIFILLMISFFSIIGTVIEQEQSIETYKLNYPLINPILGFLTWDRIIQFELDHIYKTWWFFTLILLLGFSLISCTFLQQLPTLKIARRCQFFRKIKTFYKLKIFIRLKNFSLNKTLFNIRKNQYLIFQQKNIFYCYKGLIGQIGPIMVHLSIILILSGTILASLFGFTAQEMVPKTETFHIQHILASGKLATVPRISNRINDFWITYAKNKTIFQFYSDISILNHKGNETERKTISVNYPLISNNIYYYQTDWNLIGLRFQLLQENVVEYPLTKLSNKQNKVWLTWISDRDNRSFGSGKIAIIENLEGYCSLYNGRGKFLGNIELNETIKFEPSFKLLEILDSTGLQIKTDPGIPVIYLGFFFLVLSVLTSYITYSQIWIICKNKTLFIGGTTNRAIFEFELEFFRFI